MVVTGDAAYHFGPERNVSSKPMICRYDTVQFEPRSEAQARELYNHGRNFLRAHRKLTYLSMRSGIGLGLLPAETFHELFPR